MSGRIARVWSGRVPAERASGFECHLLETGVAECRATIGNHGAVVLRRDEPDRFVRFTLLTFWEDEAAVRRFAGEDLDTAVLYAGDERFGLVPDRTVQHFHVVLRAPTA